MSQEQPGQPCEHEQWRESTDGDLAICDDCNRIVQGITDKGKLETLKMRGYWGPILKRAGIE